MEQSTSTRTSSWERRTIERLATAGLVEQRRARRWSIFFRFLLVAYIAFVTAMSFRGHFEAWRAGGTEQHTALIDMSGTIQSDGLSLASVRAALVAAFEDEATAGVVLRLNSPGGSPVQSSLIYEEIRRLKAEHPDTPVIAVVHDVAASGGYFIASAADDIYVNPSSLVGSIGVVSNGFGFTGTMEKLGVERRLITSGESKAMLDPFSPVNDDDVAHMRVLMAQIHEQFKTAVRDGRGDRLAEEPNLFSGTFWTGEQAVALGLADGFGDEYHVARDVVGVDSVLNFTAEPDLIERVTGALGAAIGAGFFEALSARDAVSLK
ncbi:MAG: S49 family peptidase [Pseudomonadota bacterium]